MSERTDGVAGPGPGDPGSADPGSADLGSADPGGAGPGGAGPGSAGPGTGDPGGAGPGVGRTRLDSVIRTANTLLKTPTSMRGFVPSYARRPTRSRLQIFAALALDLGVIVAQGGAGRARHQLRAVLPSVFAVSPVRVELAGERMGTHLRVAGEPGSTADRPADARRPRDRPRPTPTGRWSGFSITVGPEKAPGTAPRHRGTGDPNGYPEGHPGAGGETRSRTRGAFAVGAGFAPDNPLLSRDRYAQLTAQRAVEFVCAFLDAELGPEGWVGFDSAVSTQVRGDRIAVSLISRSTDLATELPDLPAEPFLRHLLIDPA